MQTLEQQIMEAQAEVERAKARTAETITKAGRAGDDAAPFFSPGLGYGAGLRSVLYHADMAVGEATEGEERAAQRLARLEEQRREAERLEAAIPEVAAALAASWNRISREVVTEMALTVAATGTSPTYSDRATDLLRKAGFWPVADATVQKVLDAARQIVLDHTEV